VNRAAAQFPLRLGIAMLNHASFGLATTSLLERAEDYRRAIEAEPVEMLTDNLDEALPEVLAETAEWLGLDPARTALTMNATSAAAAVTQSLPLGPDDHVVILRGEYPSILRGWERRCAETGATLHVIDVPVPVETVDDVLGRLDEVPAERVAVLQFSGIASSTAVRLPVADVAAWGRDRGARVVLDGAHMPGQVRLDEWALADAAFGTLHKWLPVPRSVGLLHAAPGTAPLLRPAEVSLTWDADDLGERFAWPGTFDPAPRLCLPEAIAVWRAWQDSGALARAARIADEAHDVLTTAGARAAAGPSLRAPRLRAFVVDGVPAEALKRALEDAGVVAPAIELGATGSMVRIATHVYTDADDLDRVAEVVRSLLRRGRRAT
jgi:selenocysteine lyase/cysteine desulfurase